ncbi:hypothetical protein V8C42DRAFT_33204 [Trichoderma barbatum]
MDLWLGLLWAYIPVCLHTVRTYTREGASSYVLYVAVMQYKSLSLCLGLSSISVLCHPCVALALVLTPYPSRVNPWPWLPPSSIPSLSHVALGMGLAVEHLILYCTLFDCYLC